MALEVAVVLVWKMWEEVAPLQGGSAFPLLQEEVLCVGMFEVLWCAAPRPRGEVS